MRVYYREDNGDYLAIETTSKQSNTYGGDTYEGRSVNIDGLPESMCTGGIAEWYLREDCKRVASQDVPTEWLEWIGG